MNVVCIAQYYPPHIGGLEEVARKQARSLARAGHAVSVITIAPRRAAPGLVQEAGVSVWRMRGINFFDMYFGIPFALGGWGLTRRVWRLVRAADVVHIHDVQYQISWIAYACARMQRKPIVVTQHVGLVAHQSLLVMHAQKLVYWLLGARILRSSAAVVVYNVHVASFVRAQGVAATRIQQVRNGIDIAYFTPVSDKRAIRRALALPEHRPLVLFVGRLVHKKGFRALLEARHADYDIILAGSGAVPRELANLPGVRYLGPQTHEQLKVLYQAADLFVCPSQGELFTLTMQEAAASGLPIVLSDDPGYETYELDRECIAFCAPSASELQQRMRHILADRELCARMSAYSRQLAQRWFDWERNAALVLKLYQKLEARNRAIVTTSWDDGHALDLQLAALLRKYNIPATLYIAPRNREFATERLLSDAQVRELAAQFEIGAHTVTHPVLTTVNASEAQEEIAGSKRYLEQLIGKPVVSFCYPRGAYTRAHARMAESAGYRLARTVRRFAFAAGEDPFELPTTLHAYDHWSDVWSIAKFARFNPAKFLQYYRRWDALAIALFEKVKRDGGIFHLWGHSWEIAQRGDWARLERVLSYISNQPGVVYATNGELV